MYNCCLLVFNKVYNVCVYLCACVSLLELEFAQLSQQS